MHMVYQLFKSVFIFFQRALFQPPPPIRGDFEEFVDPREALSRQPGYGALGNDLATWVRGAKQATGPA